MRSRSRNSGNTPSAPKSPSWVVERDALRLFGDRKSRAILAIYHARRSAKKSEFFVHPDIAKLNGLSPSDLNWALGELEGKLVETVKSKQGRYRTLRLLSQFEDEVLNPLDLRRGYSPTLASPGEASVEIDVASLFASLEAVGTASTRHSIVTSNLVNDLHHTPKD
jgi:hypothetical protein